MDSLLSHFALTNVGITILAACGFVSCAWAASVASTTKIRIASFIQPPRPLFVLLFLGMDAPCAPSTGLDADTKLCVSYLVGGRDGGWAKEFMQDCASRIKGRVQTTTDGHRAYLDAVEGAFGMDCDYAMLQKIYGAPSENDTRYSPAVCIGCDMKVVSGNPDPKHVSTSYVERHNLWSGII